MLRIKRKLAIGMPVGARRIVMSFIRVIEYAALLLFICANGEDNIGYLIEKTRKTWKNASQSCTLMGSERAPRYAVNVQELYPVDMEDNPHWIGATAEITNWFEFSGCYVYEAKPEEEIKKLTTRSTSIGPVADCYLQCKSHFGVIETHCYCTRDLEKGRLKGTCELITSISFENDVIGTYTHENIDKNFHLAMYKLLYGIPKIKDNFDECLVNTSTGLLTYPCDSFDSSMRTWSKAIIGGLSSSNGGWIQWTSFVRRHVMRWTKGTVSNQTITNCVSVKAVKKKKYEKVLRPCDDMLPYICQKKEENFIQVFVGFLLAMAVLTGAAAFITPLVRAVFLRSTDDNNGDLTRNNEDQTAAPSSSNWSTTNQHTFSEPVKTAVSKKIYISELPRNNEGQTTHQGLLSSSDQNEIASGSTIQSSFGQNESKKKLLKSDNGEDDTRRSKQTKNNQNPDGLM